ncbi:MAG: cytochrome C [Burkholderiaceae bacterium]|jgi:cytochrome c|uniref:c-type cytochrome n=1 Tax=Polynucleobacter sp. MWH-Loch1C5 TaxID=2689108 RepID=UPI001C0D9627|nr:c-type cytochrome [Polynucleobacter sp. MWH-Loch1C5]MBU3541892.1 c-type cytochrome [Polynucleobacter sp. MWH-Loch1C5]NBV00694.1 cytochrome C [Burkholderiaceae bacterium]
MKVVSAMIAAAVLVSAPAFASKEIAGKNACMGCHAVDKKLVGPSYKDIAARYKGQADAVDKLAKKVKAGGSGVWGPVPMPANASISDADARAVVQWILNGAN